MSRNTRSKHFTFPLDYDPLVAYVRSDCMILLTVLARVNKQLCDILVNDVEHLKTQLLVAFEGHVTFGTFKHLSDYITLFTKSTIPTFNVNGTVVYPAKVHTYFYVKKGILPKKNSKQIRT